MAPQLTQHGRSNLILEDVTADRPMRTGRVDNAFVDLAVDRGRRADVPSEQPPQRSFSRGAIMFFSFFAVFQVLAMLARVDSTKGVPELRNVMYLTGWAAPALLCRTLYITLGKEGLTNRQHPIMPVHLPEQQSITHMALAFMPSSLFNRDDSADGPDHPVDWPLFTTIEATRPLVAPSTKLLVAIGGWGDTAGFARAARTATGRRRFARNVAAMVAATGADGVDIDWEYPGGNGEDYRQVPNGQKAWEIGAYPLLLADIRAVLGPDKLLTAAVPGKPEDMLAFTADTVPEILQSVDFLNVMTYDLMNRRDFEVKHHTGVAASLAAVDAYVAAGCDPRQINLGLAYYIKYYQTEHADCVEHLQKTGSAVGCRTLLMEDPDTGADLGRAGAFSWHDGVPDDVNASFARALEHGTYTEAGGGGFGYWDEQEDLWWSFDTADTIVQHKMAGVLQARQLGGVFAWGVGEDGPRFERFAATSRAWQKVRDGGWDVDVDVDVTEKDKSNSAVTRDEL